MKLHWAPRTRAFTIVWLLEEVGEPYALEPVDIRAGAQDSAAYRAINPMGKVPALDTGDAVVTEQGAICALVADRFPAAGLAPPVEARERGPYLKWLFFAGGCIEPAFMQKHGGWQVEKSQAGWGGYDLVVDTLEQAVQPGPWLTGERFSAADVLIGSAVHFGLSFALLPSRPAFEAYAGRCRERPAFRRAQEIDER